MRKNESVTPRKSRNVTKKSWQEKLLPECLEYLAAYRAASAANDPSPQHFGSCHAWMEFYLAQSQQWPIQPGTTGKDLVNLQDQFVALMKRTEVPGSELVATGDNILPAGIAAILDMAQTLASLFEDDEKPRVYAYLAFAAAYRLAKPIWEGFRFEQTGKEPLDREKTSTLVALAFETVAKRLRGRTDIAKGRIDTELVALINCIERHAVERLTPKELHQAITASGVSVTGGESWRIRLHRMRKQGLLAYTGRTKGKGSELAIPLKEDGSIDWGVMDEETKQLVVDLMNDPRIRARSTDASIKC